MDREPHNDLNQSELPDSLQQDLRYNDSLDTDLLGAMIRESQYAKSPNRPLEPGDAPSLPIILISAACGVAGGMIALYISYELIGFSFALSAGAAILGMAFGLGISGAALTAATGERGATTNMAFSCVLIVLVALFMAMCAVAGAVVAAFLALV